MGAFCCHGNLRFYPICPKTVCSLFPAPVMLHIKFDQNWPTGFRDIQVWKCGRRWRTTKDRRRTIGILFGSGELKRIGSKTTEKRWRHHFPNYKSMRAFCCHGNQSFDPICPKTLCSLSPTPVMLHIKFDQDWPTGLRDIQVWKCKIFVIQGQVTPKWVVWSGPKSNSSELLCLSWLRATLMMIRSKMNELAWRHHFPIISLWEIF